MQEGTQTRDNLKVEDSQKVDNQKVDILMKEDSLVLEGIQLTDILSVSNECRCMW